MRNFLALALLLLTALAFEGEGRPIGVGLTNTQGDFLLPICGTPGRGVEGCDRMCFKRFQPQAKDRMIAHDQVYLAGIDMSYGRAGNSPEIELLTSLNELPCAGPELTGNSWLQVFKCEAIDQKWRKLMRESFAYRENWTLWNQAKPLPEERFKEFHEYYARHFAHDLAQCEIAIERSTP